MGFLEISSSMAEDASAIQKIEAALNKIEFMQQLEDKTQVKKLYIAAALCVVLVGFVYPAFASFKALDSKNEGEERNWLIYWVVYSCFCLVEGFLEYVLFWVPFYYPIKLAFLCFLFLPQTQGAKKLYEDVLSKVLKPYVAMIDGATADALNKVQGAASKLSGEGKESVKSD